MSQLATSPRYGQPAGWFSKPRADHTIRFYAYENELVASLFEYVSECLSREDTCIVIARTGTIIKLNKELRRAGVNIIETLHTCQYITCDAEELLEKFTHQCAVDRDDFLRTVGKIFSLAAARSKPTSVFEEMVAVLLEQQSLAAALNIEKYWDVLMRAYNFSLHCAYPKSAFTGSAAAKELFNSICNCHNQIAAR